MDIKSEILDMIIKPKYTPLTFEEFKEVLDASDDELTIALEELMDESYLFLNKKKDRFLNRHLMGYSEGTISIKNQNFGFIVSNEFPYDLYVSKNKMLDAFDKDIVLFKAYKGYKSKDGRSDEAEVIKVLKHDFVTLVGKVYQNKNKYYLENDKCKCLITELNGAKVDDIVNVKVLTYSNTLLTSSVISVIGSAKDIGIDILATAVKYGFNTKFGDDVLYEVKNISRDLDDEIKKRRLSLDKVIYTIDGDDSKDLDDAVCVKRLDNGNYFLGVYIADVSYYVLEGSKTDQEALSRGTSLYLIDTVIPMLPVRLSNDLCSLNPSEEKLTIACEMELDNKGSVISSDIFETVIKTKKRLTYSKCNELLEYGASSDASYNDLYDDLNLMSELSDILTEKFHKRGFIDFDIPKGKIVVDEKGKVIDVERIERGRSERIIENFMILANETVASTIEALDLPFIYRIHDKPDIIKLHDLKVVAGYMGYSLKADYANEVQKFLESIDEDDEFLKKLTLRAMPKAIYSEENIGHFGLASSAYTHFTSPIRRYPDLLVHRLLRKYLFKNEIDATEFRELNKKISAIAVQSSKKERDAVNAEYYIEDKKKCEYMENFVGSEFSGKINSITTFGLFITLDNTIEGLVRIKDMKDDYYIFNEHLYILKGERTGRKFRVGDSVKVKVEDVNKELNEIDFSLVYNSNRSGNRHGKENHRKK